MFSCSRFYDDSRFLVIQVGHNSFELIKQQSLALYRAEFGVAVYISNMKY